MEEHISYVVKTKFFHIYNIGLTRKYLTQQAIETLVHSYISSSLDYCNSLFYCLLKYLIQRFSTLYMLHWLPVEQRIHFKLLWTTFKALHGQAPNYIRDLLKPTELHGPSRSYGRRAFSHAAPRLWNTTTVEIWKTDTKLKFKTNSKRICLNYVIIVRQSLSMITRVFTNSN